MKKITLARPTFSDETIAAVSEVLRSGNLVQGEHVETFEQKLCDYTGAQFAVAMNSATSGLFASLIACGVKAGDEVIVPALSYIATANVIEMLGAIPVFCDIASDGFNIDCDKLSNCLSSRTRAVLAVHEFGEPLNIKFLLTFCEKNNLTLIEDAACALGTRYNGRHVGIFGKAGVFSFHPRKSITCGDGGAVITNDQSVAKRLRALRNHGLETYGGTNAGFQNIGLNFRLTEMQAVLLNHELHCLDSYLKLKYDNVCKYHQFLSPKLKKPDINIQGHSWQSYQILCSDAMQRDELITKLKNNNIFVSLGAQCIPREPYYQKQYRSADHEFPNASRANACGLVLPIHEHLHDNAVEFVITKINEEF